MKPPQRGGLRQTTPPDVITRVLALASVYKHAAIAEACGISQPTVSKILIRHGQRRVLTCRARAV
jgi:hypothetical protein